MNDTPTAVQAISAAAADVPPIPKDDYNEQQRFKFRGIERILGAVAPVLHRHGVIVVPEVVDQHWGTMERGREKTLWSHARLTIRYRFYGPAGDHIDATTVGEGLDNADKAASKAQTMAFKAALMQVLAIDNAHDDADAATPPDAKASRAKTSQGARRGDEEATGDPAPRRTTNSRTAAQQFHIEAGKVLVGDGDTPALLEARKRSLLRAVSKARTQSAKELTDDELRQAVQRLSDIRNERMRVLGDEQRVVFAWKANGDDHELVFVKGADDEFMPDQPNLQVVS